jgi:hypothetical protein
LIAQLWPHGYVTARCQSDNDCAPGAHCDADPRTAFGGNASWCVAPCESDLDCEEPMSCAAGQRDAFRYCHVHGGLSGRGDREAGSTQDCFLPCAGPNQTCCNGQCVNLSNDQNNCGHCGQVCGYGFGYCSAGACKVPRCSTSCDAGLCCGDSCCGAGETCCDVTAGAGTFPACLMLGAGESCPLPCYDCMCASPETPIATPAGERPIAELRVGDLVYSVDGEAILAVPIARVNRTPVHGHRVLHVALSDGRSLEISGPHPLADGRPLEALAAGAELDGLEVLETRWVDYGHEYTYDILPASSTGTYFAAGLQLGSTLKRMNP